jgi:type 1 glutamine amidotransferase
MRMIPYLALVTSALIASAHAAGVLIVADEFPAMQVLAGQLQKRAGQSCDIVSQDKTPSDLHGFRAVIVYIHRDITSGAEHAFIDYARGGGRLILLHHSISSAKRKNKDWLPFLGVELPAAPFEQGGYKYIDDVDYEFVNAAPDDYVTTHEIPPFDALPIRNTEVYLNHRLTGERTTLLRLRYIDAQTGQTFDQPTGAWRKTAGKGDVFYFMAGHKAADFEIPAFAQMIANAVTCPR